MRIMIIGPESSTHSKRWATAMNSRGHEVMLVSPANERDVVRELDDKIQIEYLSIGGNLGYFLNIPQLLKIYRRFKPDVVNAHYASGNGTMVRLASLRPVVLSCWGSDLYEFPYRSNINRWILKKNLKYADAVASTSKGMVVEARKILENDIDITVTPFGVYPEVFKRDKKDNNTRPVIGIVKYLEPIYDIELLIRSFAVLKQIVDCDPELHIYGGGTLYEELVLLTKELNVNDSVKFFDTIPNSEVPAALNTFDIFVNCSKHESFGVTVVEAMACELPVVVTKTAGYCEIVDNGENGIILEDRNPSTMANALARLLNDESLRKKLGQSAREKVVKEYNWNENITVMEKLYEAVIEKNSTKNGK